MMKSARATKIFASISLVLLAACHSSSSHNDDASENAALKAAHQATLSLIATKVIVPTYTSLAEKSAALKTACYTLADSPTQANLDAAKTAWIATRVPWESSEAFLFGPVEDNGYDPKMDDWPLDDQNISDNIAKNATSPVDIDAADTGVKGFHAIEFLLWGASHNKTAAQLTANELSYL